MRSSPILKGLLASLSILSPIVAAPTSPSDLARLESLRGIPQGWHFDGSPPVNQRLRFRVAMRQENAFDFEQHVLAISTPDHPKYGQHMSRDELKTMLRPSESASAAVLQWLHAEGVPSADIEDTGDWINFYVTMDEANRILDTQFHYYLNSNNGVKRIRTLHYSIPKGLHQFVHMIQPTTRFGQVLPERSHVWQSFEMGRSRQAVGRYHGNQLNATFCNTTITPQCLRDLYHIGDFRGTGKNGMIRNTRSRALT